MKSIHTEKLIEVDEFCLHYHVDKAFIRLLQQSGLLDLQIVQESTFIGADQLKQLEKIIRFHYELNINLEGIESITHLLKQINDLQDEMRALRNRLRFYE